MFSWFGLRIALLAVIGSLWLSVTASRVRVWHSERELWSEATAQSPQKVRPWVNLGRQYALVSADAPAETAYRRAIDLAAQPGRTREEQTVGWAIAEANLALVRLNHLDADQALWFIRAARGRVQGNPDIEHVWLVIRTRLQLPTAS